MGIASLASAEDMFRVYDDGRIVKASEAHVLKDYTNSDCIKGLESGENQLCFEHETFLAVGNKWYQATAEGDNLSYYQWRVEPFARGMLDWHPYIQLLSKFYTDITATVVEFDASVFAEVQLWWNYDSIGSNTRQVCWGYGYDIDTIDIDAIINLWIEECYKTLISNIFEPIGEFTDPKFFTELWSECSESTTDDVEFYVKEFYTSDDSVYWND